MSKTAKQFRITLLLLYCAGDCGDLFLMCAHVVRLCVVAVGISTARHFIPCVPTIPKCPIPFSCGSPTGASRPLGLPKRNSCRRNPFVAPENRPLSVSWSAMVRLPSWRRLRVKHCTWILEGYRRLLNDHLRQRAGIESTL